MRHWLSTRRPQAGLQGWTAHDMLAARKVGTCVKPQAHQANTRECGQKKVRVLWRDSGYIDKQQGRVCSSESTKRGRSGHPPGLVPRLPLPPLPLGSRRWRRRGLGLRMQRCWADRACVRCCCRLCGRRCGGWRSSRGLGPFSLGCGRLGCGRLGCRETRHLGSSGCRLCGRFARGCRGRSRGIAGIGEALTLLPAARPLLCTGLLLAQLALLPASRSGAGCFCCCGLCCCCCSCCHRLRCCCSCCLGWLRRCLRRRCLGACKSQAGTPLSPRQALRGHQALKSSRPWRRPASPHRRIPADTATSASTRHCAQPSTSGLTCGCRA